MQWSEIPPWGTAVPAEWHGFAREFPAAAVRIASKGRDASRRFTPRRTDLISSPGATLLNRRAAPNRPPSAFAGPDRTQFHFDVTLELKGTGTDPDRHWLTYTWTNESGQVIGRVPWIFVSHPRGTTRTYTLTVDDGHGVAGRAARVQRG